MKVQELIDNIIQKCGVEPLDRTCDQIIEGDPQTEITGIVTTFMATVDVIRQAHHLGANLIITHEPTYFTGDDERDWLEQDPVYLEKKKLLLQYGICVWRFHDYLHMAAEGDGIYRGLLRELGWENYRIAQMRSREKSVLRSSDMCYQLPATTVRALAEELKEKLHMDVIQIVGDPETPVERAGILVGGGSLGFGREAMPMELMEREKLDVLICGEILEWTICAYVWDAAMLGMHKALIIPGHNRTEEAGMKYLPEWLEPLAPGIPINFVEAGEPFSYL
mgnify:CR=1 FL=1